MEADSSFTESTSSRQQPTQFTTKYFIVLLKPKKQNQELKQFGVRSVP